MEPVENLLFDFGCRFTDSARRATGLAFSAFEGANVIRVLIGKLRQVRIAEAEVIEP